MFLLLFLVGCLGADHTVTSAPPGTCAGGDSAACLIEAKAAQSSHDLRSSAGLADQGCTLGSGEACALASDLAWARDNRPAALDYGRQACDLGYLPGCYVFAAMLGIEGQYTRMEEVYGRACDAGHGGSCAGLGLVKYMGEELPKDVPAALALWERGCLAADADACNRLGRHHALGREGATKDPALGATFTTRACELGHAGACAELASAYQPGGSLPEDPTLAAQYAAKACELGNTSECN